MERKFSEILSGIADSMTSAGLTVGEFLEKLGERGLLLLCMILTVPFLIPVSIPGSSIPFGLIIALIGTGILLNRPPWVPKRFMNHHLAEHKWVPALKRSAVFFARLERLTHPRLPVLTHQATVGRFNSAVMVLSAILLMVPLPLPFTNTLPAYGVLFLAAGSLERDGLLILAGYLFVLLTLAYFSLMGLAGLAGARTLLHPLY